MTHRRNDGRTGRTRPAFVALLVLGLLLAACFTALGAWQIERRAWKLDLIARVNSRIHAPPAPAPSPTDWPAITDRSAAYRHVSLRGRFLHDRETLVQAVTERGPGFWVMTPLVETRGFTVLVNRGFVPPERAPSATRGAAQLAGPVTVTGLLRITEPGGGFLRRNDPGSGRWYSRDVAAIAAARGLATVAPYFVDADATPNPGGYPVGGLTVVSFRNAHLQYAVTWFTLALLTLGGLVVLVRHNRTEVQL